MDIIQFKDKLFAHGKELGFSDMELYYQSNGKFSTKVYKGEIDSYDIAVEGGVSFRGICNGKMGYAYTEKVDEDSISLLPNEAKENSSIIDSEDIETIFEGSRLYEKVDLYSEKLSKVSAEEKISLLKQVEEEAFALSEKVTSVNYCLLESHDSEIMIANTKGLMKREKSNVAYIFISVVVKDEDDIKNAYNLCLIKDFGEIDTKTIAKEAVEEALSLLGADSIESKTYPIILKNTAAASLLQVFSGIFSAENVQKGKSRLVGKLEEQIASSTITIVDDPHDRDGYGSRSFDSEGVATKRLNIIENGVLNTYLHNIKTALKDKVESTGHAHKSSYKGTLSISPSNMFIQPGEIAYEDLIHGEEEALIITDLQGLHSGANPISGDFSLAAQGYLVKDGRVERPVNQITVGGNFYTVLQEVEAIGNDLEFSIPMGSSFIGSPSLKLKGLSVGGK
jgi:PmbA protein